MNRPGFSRSEREPDPELLLRGYERASLTLNFVRALIDGGFADLHHPEYWDLGFLRHSPLRDAYQGIVDSIAESLEFFESMSGLSVHAATRCDFYTSHEGLHLLSEQAQTRYIERQKKLVQPVDAHAVDRHAHGEHRRRAHRVFSRHRQSDRRESRRGDERRVAAGARAGAEPAEHARALDASSTGSAPRISNSGCRR